MASSLPPPARARSPVTWRDPLLRTGYLLVLSTGITAIVGLVFWSVAARRYETAVVGRSSAVLAAMILLGGIGHLNLSSALIRFVPGAGRGTRRLVLGMYLVAIVASAALGIGFLAIAPAASNEFKFLTDNPWIAAGFVVAVMAQPISIMQDSVLTGLALARLVAIENAVFAIAKVAIIAAVAAWLPRDGILVSWWAGLALAVVGTNVYLFRWAIKRHARLSPAAGPPVAPRELMQFAGPDYLGALCWLGAMNVVPFIVLAELGPTQTAYFAVSAQIGTGLSLVCWNMGQSLVVAAATDQSELPQQWRRVVRHTLPLLGSAVVLLAITAPFILRIFGEGYSEHGATLVRLLAVAAIPNLLVDTAISAARANRRTVAGAVMGAVVCVGVIGLAAGLVPLIGISGIGVAWLATLSVLAAVLLMRPAWWLYPRGVGPAHALRSPR